MSVAWAEAQSSAYPKQNDTWNSLSKLYSDKLWHQLGVRLSEAIAEPFFLENGAVLIELFQKFATPAVRNLNQIVFVDIAVAAAKASSRDDAIEILKTTVRHVEKDTSAAVIALSVLAEHQVAGAKLYGAAFSLDTAKGLMAGHVGPVAAKASAAFHKASAALAKARGNLAEFFAETMLYLTFTPLSSLAAGEQAALAAEVAAAALTGAGIYSFGELIQHPITTALESSGDDSAPLASLLRLFDSGDLDGIAAFNKAHAGGASPVAALLRDRAPVLRSKAQLMALGVRVFECSTADRVVPLATVARWCGVGAKEVEEVVVRAIALGIIKAEIDGVEGVVRFSWTMPRVLAPNQLAALRDRVQEWQKTAAHAVKFVTEHSAELMASTL